MNLQYILDSKGEPTGVFIPIGEWNKLKKKYKNIEQEDFVIPDWHKDLVQERLAEYKQNPDSTLDFNEAMNDIEEDL
ncbi:addiction module component CHP02574 family protein [Puteibacter caeruleilacunae]|nr:addiction module component CHP02574 family protein [Puteibacter caeruleilacunae]